MICFGVSDSFVCGVIADRLDDESALRISFLCLSDREQVLDNVDVDADKRFEEDKTGDDDDDDDDEERERGL